MTTAVPKPAMLPYWNMIKDTSNEVKMNLITLLSVSLESSVHNSKADKEALLMESFGSWETDEDEYSTEELCADVKKMMNGKDFINMRNISQEFELQKSLGETISIKGESKY